MERPGLRRLLTDIAARRVDVVVVYKVDRLTRSLRDFARIVDTLDAAGASFVSVTQAFNTTSSMGRLTLNMLLSFAQFEREVTGERIRDKIEASKRKGLWMGGNLALGYDPNGRTLVVNDAEAALVRHIFARYIALGSVDTLRDELQAQGHRSKRWVSRRGTVRGGEAFSRGALFHLLSNRLYLGQIPHKGVFYPGLHPAIIDEGTFAEAQAKLVANAGPKRRVRTGLQSLTPTSPLTGLIRDDRGRPMSPVITRQKNGRQYRYYVSAAAQVGRRSDAGSLPRVPAEAIETLVLDRARQFAICPGDDPWPELREALVSVEVSKHRVRMSLRRDVLDRGRISLRESEISQSTGDTVTVEDDRVVVEVETVLQRRGGAKQITRADGAPAVQHTKVDRILLRALVRAESWKRSLLSGDVKMLQDIASAEGVQVSYVQRVLRLAFLRPSLKKAMLEGRTPPWLTLQRLMERGVALEWAAQPAALMD